MRYLAVKTGYYKIKHRKTVIIDANYSFLCKFSINFGLYGKKTHHYIPDCLLKFSI